MNLKFFNNKKPFLWFFSLLSISLLFYFDDWVQPKVFPPCNELNKPIQGVCHLTVNQFGRIVLNNQIEEVKKINDLHVLQQLSMNLDFTDEILSAQSLKLKKSLQVLEVELKRNVVDQRINELITSSTNSPCHLKPCFASSSQALVALEDQQTRRSRRLREKEINRGNSSVDLVPTQPAPKRERRSTVPDPQNNRRISAINQLTREEHNALSVLAQTLDKRSLGFSVVPGYEKEEKTEYATFNAIKTIVPQEKILSYLADPLLYYTDVYQERKSELEEIGDGWKSVPFRKLAFGYLSIEDSVSLSGSPAIVIISRDIGESSEDFAYRIKNAIDSKIEEAKAENRPTKLRKVAENFDSGTFISHLFINSEEKLHSTYDSSYGFWFLGLANDDEEEKVYTTAADFQKLSYLSTRFACLQQKQKFFNRYQYAQNYLSWSATQKEKYEFFKKSLVFGYIEINKDNENLYKTIKTPQGLTSLRKIDRFLADQTGRPFKAALRETLFQGKKLSCNGYYFLGTRESLEKQGYTTDKQYSNHFKTFVNSQRGSDSKLKINQNQDLGD